MDDDSKKLHAKAFDIQTTYSRIDHAFTSRCAICGKEQTMRKIWYQSRGKTLSELRLQFNRCEHCGKWVCCDCYLVDDGHGNGAYEGSDICSACAKERGIIGLTVTQMLAIQAEQTKAQEATEQKEATARGQPS
ncbi:MAG: hypothetical protein LBJ11_03180 [Oscillospiraceae bacterium]|jgi:hypothetical protein|nr:hypothetical protein [Oscillospiraceae bacterium]